MIIRKHGIELHRVTHDDIELVRETRNRDDIRTRMFDQAPISPGQQEQWFRSIDNARNYYFIIHHEGRRIGLIHGKNADFGRREVEGGIFVWESSLLGTPVPAQASICFMEASFTLILMERVFARVRPDNPQAWRYNLALGYVPAPDKGEDFLVLTRAAYERRIPYLRRLAAGNADPVPLSIADVEIPDAGRRRHLYDDLPADVLDVFRPRLDYLDRQD